jgi:hypothetical protein
MMTRSEGKEKTISFPSAYLLKSSMILKSLNDRPYENWSYMKSIDQTSLIALGTVNGSTLSRHTRLRGFIRKLSPSNL